MSNRLRELKEWAKEESKPASRSNKMFYGSIIAVIVIIGAIYLYQRSQKAASPTQSTPGDRKALSAAPKA